MTKKKWALLLLCILLITGYYKLFYKTYSEKAVTKNADCIVALDVKRIINTLIWNVITTPGQWKKPSIFSPDKEKISLDDIVKIPDYVFIFHSAGQPVNAWYTVLKIKDSSDFNRGLQQYHFEKKDGLYFSKQLSIVLLQSGDSLLVGNLAVEDKNFIRQTAQELFVKNQYSIREVLEKNIGIKSHLSAQIKTSDTINENQFISANFDKEKITVMGSIPGKFGASLVLNNFTYSGSSLCTLAFTQPQSNYADIHSLLPDSVWAGISKAVNFNIDSLLLPTNNHYQLDIEGIHSRVDSAVSYSYDDNFNRVEKIVANTVEEPAFNLTVQGANINPIYNYWKNNGKLEQTAAGELFTPMPFVKSYCKVKNETRLLLTSANYRAAEARQTAECILFFKLLLTKAPPSLIKYLPDEITKATKNIASIEVIVDNENGSAVFRVSLNKKKNDLPVIEW
jgi:hypothetical protein